MADGPSNTPRPNTPPGGPAPVPLTGEQRIELERCRERAKKIFRSATVAKTDGTITAIFTAMSFLSFCFGWEGPVLGIGLGVVSYNSFQGAKRIRQFDVTAPKSLALNQALLAACIILYAAYSLWKGLNGGADLQKAIASAGDLPIDIGGLARILYWTVYGGLIVGTIVAQGLTAWYYASRERLIREYLAQTPEWAMAITGLGPAAPQQGQAATTSPSQKSS